MAETLREDAVTEPGAVRTETLVTEPTEADATRRTSHDELLARSATPWGERAQPAQETKPANLTAADIHTAGAASSDKDWDALHLHHE